MIKKVLRQNVVAFVTGLSLSFAASAETCEATASVGMSIEDEPRVVDWTITIREVDCKNQFMCWGYVKSGIQLERVYADGREKTTVDKFFFRFNEHNELQENYNGTTITGSYESTSLASICSPARLREFGGECYPEMLDSEVFCSYGPRKKNVETEAGNNQSETRTRPTGSRTRIQADAKPEKTPPISSTPPRGTRRQTETEDCVLASQGLPEIWMCAPKVRRQP